MKRLGLIRPLGALRARARVATRLELRDERIYARLVLPYLAPLYIALALVDWLAAGMEDALFYVGIRVFAVLFARAAYVLSRGRLPYGARNFLYVAPHVYAVEWVMFQLDLAMTAYFTAVPLILFAASMLAPARARVALGVYGACLVPMFVAATSVGASEYAWFPCAVLATYALGTLSSTFHQREIRERIVLAEKLARLSATRAIGEKAREAA